MKPFDLQIALKHPERVRHADGRKAVRVVHLHEAGENWRVAVVWAGYPNVETFTETGCVFAFSLRGPVLFLAPETKLVPWSSPGEIPDGCWFREKDRPERMLRVTGVEGQNVMLFGMWFLTDTLLRHWEYATSRKGPWLPCGKEVQDAPI